MLLIAWEGVGSRAGGLASLKPPHDNTRQKIERGVLAGLDLVDTIDCMFCSSDVGVSRDQQQKVTPFVRFAARQSVDDHRRAEERRNCTPTFRGTLEGRRNGPPPPPLVSMACFVCLCACVFVCLCVFPCFRVCVFFRVFFAVNAFWYDFTFFCYRLFVCEILLCPCHMIHVQTTLDAARPRTVTGKIAAKLACRKYETTCTDTFTATTASCCPIPPNPPSPVCVCF